MTLLQIILVAIGVNLVSTLIDCYLEHRELKKSLGL